MSSRRRWRRWSHDRCSVEAAETIGERTLSAKIAVESWDPEFGTSIAGPDLKPSEASVDASVEVEPSRWRPMKSSLEAAREVVFVDGVRRIDALVWITIGPRTSLGLCASYAAGVVAAADTARVDAVRARRGLFTSADVSPLETSVGPYPVLAVAGETVDALSAEIQERLRQLEVELLPLAPEAELRVVDGPLSTHHRVENAVGYVKTHRVTYLEDPLNCIVAELDPGERTPIFLTTTSWSRFSCYLRLPGPPSHPWAGIARLELPGDRPLAEAVRLADVAASTLPRYASVPHKDTRAPQNLFPIGGLERELRRRLGDARLVHRAIRRAASLA